MRLDGTDFPDVILDNAVEAGLSAIALTDHNTVAGLPEFLEAAKGKDILAIPGVEISTGYNGKLLHIVGLFLEPEHPKVLNGEAFGTFPFAGCCAGILDLL